MTTHPGSSAALEDELFVSEDVMREVNDLSRIRKPLWDIISTGKAERSLTEWLEDKLPVPTMGGFRVDGADSTGNSVSIGERIGNYCGILDQSLSLTGRAQSVDSFGGDGTFATQLRKANDRLMRNFEANNLGNQGSQEDDGDTTPGQWAGLGAMATQYDTGSGGSGGGWVSAGTWTAWTPGTRQPFSFNALLEALQAAYDDNADISILMAISAMIAKLSRFMFTSDAPIATLTRETLNVAANGSATAVASVNVIITDFGATVQMKDNRLQQPYTDVGGSNLASSVFLIDPEYLEFRWLRGVRVANLAKSGDADKKQMLGDGALVLKNREACRVMPDIDHTADVAA